MFGHSHPAFTKDQDASTHTNYLYQLLKNEPAHKAGNRVIIPECRSTSKTIVGGQTSRNSSQRYPRETPFAHLIDMRAAGLDLKGPVLDTLAVDAHGALADHPEGLGGAGDQLGLPQHMGDPHGLPGCLYRDRDDVVGQFAVLEPLYKGLPGLLGGSMLNTCKSNGNRSQHPEG